jgi:anthranilate phosphoribosyltransferase
VSDVIQAIENGQVLTRQEAEAVMEELLLGRTPTPDIVRLLTAFNRRPIQAQELAGFASVMRKHAAPVFAPGENPLQHMVDTCGTGGDGFDAFNISTAAAIVAAAAGARVAKHGNRAASSKSGSADVLEALGVRTDLPCLQVGKCIREVGIGFLYAPAAHASTRHAAPARKEIAARTIFNLLGPLTNPAGAQSQVLGVFSDEVLDLVAATLAELGIERAFVVHGEGGLDEISLAGETRVVEVHRGSLKPRVISPEDFAIKRAPLEAIRGGRPSENAATISKIFGGELGPRHDIVVINSAAALVACGVAEDFRDAAQLAGQAIASGAANDKLLALVKFTQAPWK